ncbi:O-antigen polymerase [Marinifilum sp. D737]|uniref:O-antigen polymerase n=1 Tax=Marinifilum sp. D737 TaxID=2969628 RepID=UPI002276C792|nr:O-antigen polymerase [Marinifilum sp. D737]MCY1635009.1 oligosaccharide repeat unit polymerase [Marinifilum sp. D737]
MSKEKFTLLLVSMFLVFTQGMWERLFFLTPIVGYVVDFSIVLFIFWNFRINISVPGLSLIVCYLGFEFLVGLLNSNSVIDTILYIRYFVYFYLIFAQLYCYSLGIRNWLKLLKFSIFLILLQGIGAVYNLLILGERVEGYVGLMASLGGTTATIFPLFISSIVLLIYLNSRFYSKKIYLIYLLIMASVFLVGYSSGKRTIYFIIPIFILITFMFSIDRNISKTFFQKKFITMTILGVLFFPVLIFGITNSRGLNNDLSGNENSLGVISNAINYVKEYESATDQYGNTIGRSNTTKQIIVKSSNLNFFLTGVGFGSIKNEQTKESLGIGYGVVGLTRDIISAGWISALLVILIFTVVIFRNNSYFKSSFNSILRRLLFMIFIYTYFFYSSDFSVSLKITFFLAIILALINSPRHRFISLYIQKKLSIL